MNKIISILLLATLFISFSACKKIVATGPTVTETRNVDYFSQVYSYIPGDVYIKIGTSQDIIIEGQQNIIDEIETGVENGKLFIRNKNNHPIKDWGNLKVYITVTVCNGISLRGSGNISTQSDLNATNIDLSLTGSGNLQIQGIESTNTYISLTGSGNIELDNLKTYNTESELTGSGHVNIKAQKTEKQKVKITGSGDFNARHLESQTADINITGSGNATVWATQTLNANIAGSGSITYYGTPAVNISITGTGKIKQGN